MKPRKIEKFYRTQVKFYDFTRKFFLFNRKKAIELLDIKKDENIIDLACGTGLNFPYLIKKVSSANIIGIDYSKSMLDKAKKKYPEIRLIKGNVATYRFPEKVDKIISTYSISMIDKWEKTIINARETLNKNGTFLILDFHPWKGIIKIIYPLFKWWLKKHEVDPEKEVIPFLERNFNQIDVFILNSGYNYIAIAKKEKTPSRK